MNFKLMKENVNELILAMCDPSHILPLSENEFIVEVANPGKLKGMVYKLHKAFDFNHQAEKNDDRSNAKPILKRLCDW